MLPPSRARTKSAILALLRGARCSSELRNPPCLPHGWGADPAGHYPGFIRLLPLTQGEHEPTFPAVYRLLTSEDP